MNTVALAIIAVAFLFQLLISKTRFSAKRTGFLIFALSFFLIFGFAGYYSYQQYHTWKGNAFTQAFLPPHQNFDYFVYYARYHFFDPYLLSLGIGILFFTGACYLNKKCNGRFFEAIEPYLLATSLFLAGTPGWLVYIFVFFALYLSVNIFFTLYEVAIKKRQSPRVALYHLWLPSALFTILISKWLMEMPQWQILKF